MEKFLRTAGESAVTSHQNNTTKLWMEGENREAKKNKIHEKRASEEEEEAERLGTTKHEKTTPPDSS
jgi:hypothetical protein